MSKKQTNPIPQVDLLDLIKVEAEPVKPPPPSRAPLMPYPVRMMPVAAVVEASALQKRRSVFDPQSDPQDAELLQSVREKGVVVPIMVQEIPGDPDAPAAYRLVYGERRLSAARLAGLEYVLAQIIPASEPAESVHLFTVAENLGRKNLTWRERAETLRELQNLLCGAREYELAKKTGVPRNSIRRLLNGLDNPLVGKLMDSGIKPHPAETIGKLLEKAAPEEAECLVPVLCRAPAVDLEHIEQMVIQGGMDLRQAVETTTGRRVDAAGAGETSQAAPVPAGSGSPAQAAPEPKKPRKPARQKGDPAKTDSQKAGSYPGVHDDQALRELADLTGAAKTWIPQLMLEGACSSMNYEMLAIACLAACSYKDRAAAVKDTIKAYRDKSIAALLHRRFLDLQKAKVLQKKLEGKNKNDNAAFLAAVFGNR